MSSKIKPSPGDWICQNRGGGPTGSCGNLNFASRQKCHRCHADRREEWIYKKAGQELGKQAAEQSRGLFNPDDWICKTCGNVNWARRMNCNMCKGSKVQKVENRSGYGGGYKDRDDVVEYKEREESDGEYDEFGLKKKKYRGQTKQDSNDSKDSIKDNETKVDARPGVEESGGREDQDSVEEEEEEEDDGDLDKYNLDFDEDDDLKEMVKEKQNKERSLASPSDDSSTDSNSSSSDSGSSSGSESEDSRTSGSGSSSDDEERPQIGEKSNRRYRSRSRSPLDRRNGDSKM